LFSAIHQAGRDTDEVLPFPFFDDHRVTQVGWGALPRKWKAAASALPLRRVVFTVHRQESIGVVREVIAGKEWQVRIMLGFQGFDELPGIR